jgi:hypothetical protein
MGYAAYVLVPYVGHRLIAEDLSCSAEEVYEVMVESRKVRTILHPLDDSDPDIDNTINMNNKMIRRDKERVLYHFPSSVLMFRVYYYSIPTRQSQSPKAEILTSVTLATPMVARFPIAFTRFGRYQVSNASLTSDHSFPTVCHLNSPGPLWSRPSHSLIIKILLSLPLCSFFSSPLSRRSRRMALIVR